MTCMPLTQSRHRNPLVPALVCAALVVLAVTYAAHAVERHGSDAEAIRKCLENKPPSMELQNPLTGRIALICWTNEKYGIQIVDRTKTQEITSFFDKGSKTIEQVVRYLFNAGYTGVP